MRAPYLVLVSVLLAAPAARAAPAPAAPSGPSAKPAPGPAPSRQGRDLSRALVPQKTWDSLLDRSAEGLSSAVSRSLAAKGEKAPEGLQGTIRKELARSMSYEAAVDAQAQALQKRFSTGELEEATRFYQSPVGKKMLDQLPAAQGEVGDQLQERLAAVVPDIIHKVAPSAMEGAHGGGASPGAPGAASPPSGTGSGADAPAPRSEAGGKSSPRKL